MKNAMVLVSHSAKITEGLKEMIETMVHTEPGQLTIVSAGGTEEGGVGTTPTRVLSAIQLVQEADRIYIFTDMGSAVMSAESALDFLDEDIRSKVHLLNEAPLVEGAYIGALQCSIDADPDALARAVKDWN